MCYKNVLTLFSKDEMKRRQEFEKMRGFKRDEDGKI